MVGAGTWVEDEVGPFTKIAVTPGGDTGLDAGSDFCVGGAGEGREVEIGPLRICKGDFRGKGGELVEPGFVVAVSGKVRLRSC